MLQQTRATAVIPYYTAFLKQFPTVAALAEAAEPEVLTAWAGLGYYSRARNLHKAAKQIAKEGLPASHAEILALPGVGPYTAAAVASIALDLPHSAVDGNVMRVLSRLLNDASEISSPKTRLCFATAAQQLIDPRRPGDFNQAMMELGATICVPRNPACGACPLERFCAARAAGTERELPVKVGKPAVREVELNLLLLAKRGSVYLVQRPHSGKRLAGFWELPEIEPVIAPEACGKLARLCGFCHRIVNDNFRVTLWKPATSKLSAHARRSGPGNWLTAPERARIPVTTISRKALKAAGIG